MRKWEIPKAELAATIGHIMEIEWNKEWRSESVWIDFEVFEPNLRINPEKKDLVKDLETKIEEADLVYIMTDFDFAWQQISSELYDIYKKHKKKMLNAPFREVIAKYINESIENATSWPIHWMYEAGKTRLALDRIIGRWYSSLVSKYWNWLKDVSAWRVQSPALRILAERELEITKFASKPYFTIQAHHPDFLSWHEMNAFRDEDWNITFSEEEAEEMLKKLDWIKDAKVISYEEKPRSRSPYAPFKKSTLQAAASSILWMWTKQFDAVAQRLYDSWYTSYIRTDAVRLDDEKNEAILKLVAEEYPKEYQLKEWIYYENSKSAQEWHIWISPTKIEVERKVIDKALWEEFWDLYDLIRKRAIASQMPNAEYMTQKVILDIWWENFIVKWEKLLFDWFLKVYNFSDEEEAEEDSWWLEPLKKWDLVKVKKITTTEHKTKPKPRYNTASLIKILEKYWIWRPSTYSSILTTLEKRWYVELQWKKQVCYVTEKWIAVYEALMKFAEKDIMDFWFTSDMEEKRDELAKWKVKYLDLMKEFFEKISETMEEHWVFFNEDWFVRFNWSSKAVDVIYSEVLDPFDKSTFLIERNSENWKYLKSEINWANFPSDVEFTWEKCPDCWWPIMQATSQKWNLYKCCSFTRAKKEDWETVCNYFEKKESKQEDTWLKCPRCWEWTIVQKETSKWLIQICSTWDKCDFFNFLWKVEQTWEECEFCCWEMIVKTFASWKKRKECINRFYDIKKKENYGCENPWTWVNED